MKLGPIEIEKDVAKQAAIWIVVLLFVGEMLYSFFIHAAEMRRQAPKERADLLPAVFTAKVKSIALISTEDKALADLLKKNGLPVLKIGSTYMINEGLDRLQELNISWDNYTAIYTEKLLIENVTLANATISAYYEAELKIRRYIPVNTTIAISGKAQLSNGSLVGVYPQQLFVLKKPVDEITRVLNVSSVMYKYLVPFEKRNLFRNRDGAHISDVVFTSQPHKTNYTVAGGDAYVVVDENFTNITQLLADFPDARPQTSYIEGGRPLDDAKDLNYTIYEIVKVNISDVGLLELPINFSTPTNSTVHVNGSVFTSGEWVFAYNLSVEPVDNASEGS